MENEVIKGAGLAGPSAAPKQIDPTNCIVFAGNGRADAVFDPVANAVFIDDIRRNGQTMAVLARPVDNGFEIIAGSRRLNAILQIRHTEPERMLKAYVGEVSDEQAWKIADKENANRRDLTPIQRARTFSYAIERLHGGSQKSFALAEGLSEPTVSRTLKLLELPAEVLSALSKPEAVSVNFAIQFLEKFENTEKLEEAKTTCRNLVEQGSLFTPAGLLDALCSTPAELEAREARYVDFSGIEKFGVVKPKRDGGILVTIKDIKPAANNLAARKALLKALHAELSRLLLPPFPGETDAIAAPVVGNDSRDA